MELCQCLIDADIQTGAGGVLSGGVEGGVSMVQKVAIAGEVVVEGEPEMPI